MPDSNPNLKHKIGLNQYSIQIKKNSEQKLKWKIKMNNESEIWNGKKIPYRQHTKTTMDRAPNKNWTPVLTIGCTWGISCIRSASDTFNTLLHVVGTSWNNRDIIGACGCDPCVEGELHQCCHRRCTPASPPLLLPLSAALRESSSNCRHTRVLSPPSCNRGLQFRIENYGNFGSIRPPDMILFQPKFLVFFFFSVDLVIFYLNLI